MLEKYEYHLVNFKALNELLNTQPTISVYHKQVEKRGMNPAMKAASSKDAV